MSRILVTGANGYLGGRLVGRLSPADGTIVRALVRRPAPMLPVDEEVVMAFPADAGALAVACATVDVVVHLAGSNEVQAVTRPEASLSETIVGTWQLAAAAVAAGVRRFVYVSTVHVYGPPDDGATLTEESVPAPRSPYAIARLASEHLANTAGGPGMEVVVLRLTNSVGAPADLLVDRWSLVANDICRQAVVTGMIELRSDGLQWRDFVPIGDVCRMIEATLAPGPVGPGTYNLGMGTSMTVLELAGLVQDSTEELTGRRPALVAPAARPQPPGPHHVAVGRLGQLGLRAESTVRAAVDETLLFCLANRTRL